jgi:hypothetical protein
MKKLFIFTLLGVAGISLAAEIKSYEVTSGQQGSRPQVCAGLVKKAKKNEQSWNTDRSPAMATATVSSSQKPS